MYLYIVCVYSCKDAEWSCVRYGQCKTSVMPECTEALDKRCPTQKNVYVLGRFLRPATEHSGQEFKYVYAYMDYINGTM